MVILGCGIGLFQKAQNDTKEYENQCVRKYSGLT